MSLTNLKAYQKWVKDNGEENIFTEILDLTHDELFYLSYAQVNINI